MSYKTQLPNHLLLYNPDFNTRARGVNIVGKTVTGTLIYLENAPAIKTKTGVHLIHPDTLQPFVPAVGAFVGDLLFGTESDGYGETLSSWTGAIVYDKNEKIVKVYDIDTGEECDINDFAFDKVITVTVDETKEV